jgi:hypothetical protein
MARRSAFNKKIRRGTGGLNPSTILRPRKKTNYDSTSVPSTPPTRQQRFDEEVSTSMPQPGGVSIQPPRVTSNISSESSLPYVRNPYPEIIGDDPSPNYIRAGGKIVLQGQFEENSVSFSDVNTSGISTCSGTSFNFLVQFEDGSLHTSPLFLSELRSEASSANPYRHKNTVAVVKVDSNFLTSYGKKDIFDIPEQYAEVTVNDTIDNRKKILYHIDWLTSSGDELRTADSIGSWSVQTTEALGFDHADALDALNGVEPIKDGGNVAQSVSTGEDPIVSTDVKETDATPTPVEDVYPPFGYKGTRKGEVKKWSGDGNDYIWKPGRKKFGRRGKDRGTWEILSNQPSETTPTPKPRRSENTFTTSSPAGTPRSPEQLGNQQNQPTAYLEAAINPFNRGRFKGRPE